MTRFSCLLSASLALTAAASSLKKSLQPPQDVANRSVDRLASSVAGWSGSSFLVGSDCWLTCGEQVGYCLSCGSGHACCSSGDDGVPECVDHEGFVDDVAEYQCVTPTIIPGFVVDSAFYGSVGMGSIKFDVTDKVNELIVKNGIMDFTAGEELNTVFGDGVPGVAKVLSVQKGQHLQEFEEGWYASTYSLARFMHQVRGSGAAFEQPSIYVAVLSRRVAETRRSLIRDMWSRAVGHSGNVTMKFVLCRAGDDLEYKVDAEQAIHGDLILLHCKEGEDEAKLTQKVYMAMKEFKGSKPSRDFFMSVDDDTFVAWRRLSNFMTRKASGMMYAGVPVEDTLPCRNPASSLYEPMETFPGDAYPATMHGGAGFILGRGLVDAIFREGVALPTMLWNRERAVAVWVDEVVQKHTEVDYMTIPGHVSTRSWNDMSVNASVWKDYPYYLHHGLHGVTISCLALADSSGSPWHQIRRCFVVEVSEEDDFEDEPVCWER